MGKEEKESNRKSRYEEGRATEKEGGERAKENSKRDNVKIKQERKGGEKKQH